ncbi:hypothetical protein [Aedoeadaptatus acetigenes]|uniref:hypothetical protein n=1 Tax=Aedoeadaptatus acetigenes TaxID=2981723 RepID=UPI0011DD0829|nr:hypothetical protein [Aedoeadaptatus acetigenes]MCU6787402.1 hypothetical protein [Aedoeadaptatus acetigenes]
MNKKFLSLVLALVMVLGTFSSVFAAPAEKKETKEAPKAAETVVPKLTGKKAKIDWLKDRGYISGRKVNEDPKNNDLALDKTIQRAEVSKLLVFATGNENKVDALKSITIYKDVELNYWANGYINVGSTEPSKANNLPFLLGYPGNVFKPVNNVTYAELAKMLVTLTKTDLTKAMHDQANKNWPAQWMAWAADLGIFDDVTVADANKAVNREDAFTMIFNAMYRLKEIKVMPANETMGILSQIKNGEITINQGEKAKTVKLTDNTTFVLYKYGRYDVNAEPTNPRIVKASAISNAEYYYGSLVRVLVNEKGEATHVLELGNPDFLALGIGSRYGENNRWDGVADNTIETAYRFLAKVNYKDGDAKSILFRDPSATTGGVEVKLTKATKYFVADAKKNQLTEVKDADEALRIVGNPAATNWIDRVYVGYNDVGSAEKHETSGPTAIQGYNEATVVVFNKVEKDNNGEVTLRVKNDVTSKYNITLEDVDGKEVIADVATYRGGFPNNFNADKLDVIKWTNNNAAGIGIEKAIDHSKTERYPIVKVIDKDGAKLVVEDKLGNTARLVVDSEADIFLNGQLKEGALIQFRTLAGNVPGSDATDANTVDIVSVMPKGVALAGVLQGVVLDNQGNQYYAKNVKAADIKGYNGTNNHYKVIVNQLNSFYNTDDGVKRDLVWMSKSETEDLQAWLKANDDNANIRYKLKDNVQGNENEAYDLEVLYGDKWLPVADAVVKKAADDKAAQKAALDAFNKKVAAVEDASKLADQAAFDKAAKELKALVDEFNALKVDMLEKSDVDKAKADLNTKIKALNDAAGAKTPAIKTNPTVTEIA